MNYKLPKPEDYPDINEYQFKISRAYTKLYGDTVSLLVNIKCMYDALKDPDEYSIEWVKSNLHKLMKEYQIDES